LDGYELQFLGAARTVTGSKYLVRAGGTTVLVDCGLFQGFKDLRQRNWAAMPVEASTIDHVVLTHAHIDHTGYLPRLVAQGFAGPVWGTAATHELCDLMLRDSAHLQEEEAEFANRRGYSKHNPALPLYRIVDAERALQQFKDVAYGVRTKLSDTVEIVFHPAGHILGSAIVEVIVRRGNETRTIAFSGDLGRYDAVLMKDPSAVPAAADYLVVESTYGNREHEDKDPRPHFKALIEQIVRDKGVLLIPAFAVGRTQDILLLLKEGMAHGDFPRVPVHLDSPMAVDATEIYCRHTDEQRAQHKHEGDRGCAQYFGELQLSRTVEDSKALNRMSGPRVIISASGMATGGRILHHLKHRLPDPKSAVLFVGFQAGGTRGRRLVDGEKELRMLGEMVPVRAHIDRIDALSAHADRSELVRWTNTARKAPQRVFVTHGEPEAAESIAALYRATHGWEVRVPDQEETFALFGA